jgi:superfamily II DNA or RNA helicase
MADTTAAAAPAARLPGPDVLARVESFAREPFVLPGEAVEEALGPRSPRRQAFDAALAELEAGAERPSTGWRRAFSLMLGLERVLSDEEPRLADGTLLNPHQVDALSGTLTALLASVPGAESPPPPDDAALLASPVPPGEEDDSEEEPLEDAEDEDGSLGADEEQLDEAPEDPNAHKRFWFEHATGAGKTVAALGFVEASRTGGVLILTHRRNLVDQFHGELRDRGYADRITGALTSGQDWTGGTDAPVTVETYQWFVRNAGSISSAYTVVICDEAHTALGEKTAATIRAWTGPVFIGMTATGALIARHVTDLFPTQTSRFDLAQAARRGVIAPLRCIRIPPGPGVRTIAKVPLRKGDVDVEFDQELLAELLDQLPFNLAAADLYKTRFAGVPGVVYAAGVRHAYHLAEAFREQGIKAQAVSGETPKRELAEVLARYERGDVDVLINAQLLAEGWNSPRATVCLHLAPTASKRIYQQRVGRVTRRQPGKEAGIVVDFVHPGTKHDDPVVTLHSLLDRDVYRGGAIVVGPVRRGRGRRVRVERRVLPVCAEPDRRAEVFERELWRIAVEHLDWEEQLIWAALAGARVAPSGWRRARAMLHFDRTGDLKRAFLVSAVKRNRNPQLRLRAIQEIAAARDGDAFDEALESAGQWPREDRREAARVMLHALAEKRIGRRDQAQNWIWRLAEYTQDLHEEYAVQRWPETKRLLGLLVNSSGGAHGRNARRLVAASRKQDRRLSAALLAAAMPHTAEAGDVVNGARARLARKPSALSRELLKNFPKGKRGRATRRRRKGARIELTPEALAAAAVALAADRGVLVDALTEDEVRAFAIEQRGGDAADAEEVVVGDTDPLDDAEPGDDADAEEDDEVVVVDDPDDDAHAGEESAEGADDALDDELDEREDPAVVEQLDEGGEELAERDDEAVGADAEREAEPEPEAVAAPPRPRRRRVRIEPEPGELQAAPDAAAPEPTPPKRRRPRRRKPAEEPAPAPEPVAEAEPTPEPVAEAEPVAGAEPEAPKPRRRRARRQVDAPDQDAA